MQDNKEFHREYRMQADKLKEAKKELNSIKDSLPPKKVRFLDNVMGEGFSANVISQYGLEGFYKNYDAAVSMKDFLSTVAGGWLLSTFSALTRGKEINKVDREKPNVINCYQFHPDALVNSYANGYKDGWALIRKINESEYE